MLSDVITVRLRLPGLAVLGAREWEDHVEVVAQYGNEEAVRPAAMQSQLRWWDQPRNRTS